MTVRRATQLLVLLLWAVVIGYCVYTAAIERDPALRYRTVVESAAIALSCMWFTWLLMCLSTRHDLSTSIPLSRLIWTLGLISLFIHILIAMGVAHRWSHAAAVEHVRKVGGYGGGIIVNYLFAAVWSADVIWWWAKPESHAMRARWISWAVHSFLIFVVLNATVVFGAVERRAIYWVAVCPTLLWWLIVPSAMGWLQSRLGRKQEPGQRPGSEDASTSTETHSPT